MKVRVIHYGRGSGSTWAVEYLGRRRGRPQWAIQFDARTHGKQTAVRWARRQPRLELV